MKKITLLFFFILMSVSLGWSQVYIDEDFAGGALPTGWTNNDISSSGETWMFNNPGGRTINSPMSAPVAIFDSDDYGTGPAENAALETPAFDATSATAVELRFDHYFDGGYGGQYNVEVYNGTAWVNVLNGTTDTANPASETIDISTHVVGISNAQVRFRWVGDYSWYWIVDNIYVGAPPACITPTNTMNTAVSATTADFSWDAEATATSGYNWVVMADGEDPDTDTPVTTGSVTSGTTAQATGLSSNTAYDFYVQSNCGTTNGLSTWSLKVDFRTDCDIFTTLPFEETFNSASTTENCWTVIDNNTDGDTWNMNYTTNPFEGNQTAVFITDFNSGNNDDYLVTPTITLTGNERLKFQYRAQSSGEPNDFQVTLSTTGVAVGNFTNVLMPLTVVSNTTYQEQIIDLSAYTGNVNIAFHVPSGGLDGYRLYIDSVVVEAIPSCIVPINATNTAVTVTTADFSWDAETTATDGYNWVVMADGEDPDTDTPVTTGSVTSGTTAQATGLSSNTAYDFYVQSNCGTTNGLSTWSLKVDFRTDCNVFSTLPFEETFNSASTTESCWTVIDNNNDGDSWNMNYTTNPFEGNQTAVFITDFNGGNNDDYLVTPTITLTGNERLKFQYRAQSSGEPNDFQVTLSTTGIAVGNFTNVLMPLTVVSNTTYQEQIIDLSAYTGNVNIAFHVPSGGLDGYRLYIDSVVVEAIPSCLVPTNIQNTAITAATADFSWDAEATATDGYNWVVMANGEDPAVDTPVTSGAVTTGTTAQATGLSSNTPYDFYVRSDCGSTNGLSTWSLKVDFMTSCSAVTSFFENFDSVTTPAFPSCWSKVGTSGSANTQTTSSNSTPNTMYIYGSSSSAKAIVAMPEVSNLGDGTHRFRFNMRANFTVGGVIEVGYLNDPSDATTFVSISSVTAASLTYNEYIVNIPAGSYSNYPAFRHTGSPANSILIDDVNWELQPSCIAPINVQNTVVTATTADFSWDAEPNATIGYNWVVMVDGEDPLLDTPVASGSVTTGTTVQATGLSPETAYDFYVQSDCGATDGISTWSTKVDFTTACAAKVAPYIETFSTNSTPDCWTESGDTAWKFSTAGDYAAMTAGDHTYIGTTNYAWMDGSDNGDGEISTLTSPLVDISSLTDPSLEFYVYSFNTDGPAANHITLELYDGASWIQILNVTSVLGPEWVRFVYDLSTFNITGDVQVRFTVTGSANGGDTYYNDVLFDDISFIEKTTCLPPTNIENTDLTGSTADFSWTAEPGATSGYNWVVMADGDDPVTDTPVSTGTAPSGATTVQATGLMPETAYDFYLQSDCGTPNGMSGWSRKEGFVTEPICMMPINVENIALTTSTADFSWDAEPNASTGYNWVVMANGDDPDVDTPVTSGTEAMGTTIAQATGLTADTNYDFYVQSDCGTVDGLSDWSAKVDFYTGYCISQPSSNDGTGYGDIDVETATFNDNADSTYENYTSTPVTIGLSEVVDIQIDLNTGFGYGYDYHIWVDYNNDLVFDDTTEKVVTGATTAASDVVINESFTFSATTPGQYRMRIASADSGQFTPNPCYNGSYGNTADFVLELVIPCDTPTGVMVSNLTATTADFSWTASPHEQNGYNWVVMADGEDPLTDTPVTSGSVGTGVTIAQATGLTTNTNYDFYVQTNCGSGATSDWSTKVDFMPNVLPCAEPTAVTNTSVTLTTADFSWTASADETNGYTWYVMADGEVPGVNSAVKQGTLATGITIASVTGLNPATNYDFYVRTNCGSGNVSDWSTKLDFMTDNYPCTAPSSVNDSGITSTTAKFSWPTNGLETGGYTWVLMADGVSPDVSTALFTGTTATGVTSVTVTGLTPNTPYDFYVQTNCPTETSPWSNVVDVTTSAPPCDAPTGLMTTTVAATTVDFNWTASAQEQNGYNWVVMNDGDHPSNDTPVDSGNTGTGVTMAQATGLMANTDYDIYVQTNCETGNMSDWSLVLDFMTAMPPCEDPSALTLDNATGTSLEISWTASTTETDGYEWILMADGDDPAADTPVDSGSVATGVTMVTISGLGNFSDYDFYLQANCGSGNMSNWVMLDVSTVRTDEENFRGFEYYPNPVRSDLVMKANHTISQIVVYNLLGQQVMKASPNRMEAILDFSTLQAGAYMVQVHINDAVKTIRIIKE